MPFGLNSQTHGLISPQKQFFTSTSLAAGASVTFTSNIIPTDKNGYLKYVYAASDGLVRVTVQNSSGNVAILFPNGGGGSPYEPTLGFDTTPQLTSFVCVCQNIGVGGVDIDVSLLWDQY